MSLMWKEKQAEGSSQSLTQLHFVQGTNNKIVPLLASILFILYELKMFIFTSCIWLHVCKVHDGAQQKFHFPWNWMELWMVVSLHVGPGSQTWVP